MENKTLGIILAAGTSSRLFPTTLGVTKQLLSIYDKPLIYYPLSTLMLAGIRDVLIITSPNELHIFERLLNHHELGINLEFATQTTPKGIAEAFTIAKQHYGDRLNQYNKTCLILGDNVFYGAGFTGKLAVAMKSDFPMLFSIKVKDPERFGVVEFVQDQYICNRVTSIEEKPREPKSHYAATGLYFYPQSVYDYVEKLKPSKRGELEITDLNNIYVKEDVLGTIIMGRGMSWFDTGTPDAMMQTSLFVQTIQEQQDILVGSPHEVAYTNGWITEEQLVIFANLCGKTKYGEHLLAILGDNK